MTSSFRQLLPAPPFLRSPDVSETDEVVHRGKSPSKRVKRVVACDLCRKQKLKCDAARPACSRCSKRGAKCQYISQDDTETVSGALKRENQSLKEVNARANELLRYLIYMPEHDAQVMLKHLRSQGDSEQTLKMLSQELPNSRRLQHDGHHERKPSRPPDLSLDNDPYFMDHRYTYYPANHNGSSSGPPEKERELVQRPKLGPTKKLQLEEILNDPIQS